jgi:hypothetical protein
MLCSSCCTHDIYSLALAFLNSHRRLTRKSCPAVALLLPPLAALLTFSLILGFQNSDRQLRHKPRLFVALLPLSGSLPRSCQLPRPHVEILQEEAPRALYILYTYMTDRHLPEDMI